MPRLCFSLGSSQQGNTGKAMTRPSPYFYLHPPVYVCPTQFFQLSHWYHCGSFPGPTCISTDFWSSVCVPPYAHVVPVTAPRRICPIPRPCRARLLITDSPAGALVPSFVFPSPWTGVYWKIFVVLPHAPAIAHFTEFVCCDVGRCFVLAFIFLPDRYF